MKRVRGLLILMLLVQPLSARAQSAALDPVLPIYEQLYHGDSNGSYARFRALAEHEPRNLAASFGVLAALYARGLDDAGLQKEFEQRIDQLIKDATARYEKSKQDKEALFYLAQGYLQRARYRADFDKGVWGAARDGIKAKNYGDEYIKVDPGRADGYVAVGLYNYYIEIVPTFFKFLRVLLFMPSGDRAEGLKQIERAARGGVLWGPFAQSSLMGIYTLENRFEDALRLSENLQKKYPENPDHRFELADVYSNPQVEEFEKAAQQYSTIIQRVDEKHPNYKADHRFRAILNLAETRSQQWRLQDSIAILTPAINGTVPQQEWVLPNLLLARGAYRVRIGDTGADEDPRRILIEAKWKPWHKAAQDEIRNFQQGRQTGEWSVFAELIPGNRLVTEHRWDEARQEFERVRVKRPDDWQVRYRLAYLEFARGNYSAAETALSPIANGTSAGIPFWIKANAMLHLARAYDLRGQRDQAIKLYRRIADDDKYQAARSGAQLGLITPYRRPAR